MMHRDEERVFVFTDKNAKSGGRSYLFAIPESKLEKIETLRGSENCFMRVNGIEVEGSFDAFLTTLGHRIDIK